MALHVAKNASYALLWDATHIAEVVINRRSLLLESGVSSRSSDRVRVLNTFSNGPGSARSNLEYCQLQRLNPIKY